MKETAGSLRAYFFLVAVLGGLAALVQLLSLQVYGVAIILFAANLCISGAYLYLAIKLPRLIVDAPIRVRNIVLAGGALLVLSLLLNLVFFDVRGILQGIVGVLIVWYLLSNVRRLAAETASRTAVEEPPRSV